MILDEIFKPHGRPRRARPRSRAIDAVVHFKITDAPRRRRTDVYEVVIKDGAITVNDEPTSDAPRVTITAAPVPFLKLVTGQESGPTMFMTGKLKIKGDLMFASQMTSFFRIPSAA